jgi:hypothetical protein
MTEPGGTEGVERERHQVRAERVQEKEQSARTETTVGNLQRSNLRWGKLLLFAVLTNILFLIAAGVYAHNLNQSTERKFCAILASNSSDAPPTTQRSADIARKLTKLTQDLGCPDQAPGVTPTTYGHPSTGGSK